MKGENMKKSFKLENLDCAACAAKMEEAIKKVPGIVDANVNFLMQKVKIEFENENYDTILKEVKKVCKKVEPGCTWLD
jgi:copper chaperone CopZ